MSLLKRIKGLFKPEEEAVVPASQFYADESLDNLVTSLNRGHVVKATKRADYLPGTQHSTGGRVVRVMPRKLKQIKEAQERTEDE